MGKSVCVTYFLWLIGGWLGLHHIYLGRDRHAFLTWSLLAGYFGLGLIRDLWKIPTYCKDANNDSVYLEQLIKKMRKHKSPPYSFVRQCAQVITGNLWGYAFQLAVPEELVYGITLRWLIFLVPVTIALGVHTAGNIGREQGSMFWPLLGASSWYICHIYDMDGISIAAFISSCLFEAKGKEWRRKQSPKKPFCRRLGVLGICALIYSSLWVSFLYFNAEVTESSGETIKFRDALTNFLASPFWNDLKRNLKDLFNKLWNQGWHDTWKQLMDELDPLGERKALEVLGLQPTASQEEITARWRKLSKEWHPDRYMDEDKKKEAQEKFLEFNAAYETLSSIKARRSKRNKSFQDY